MSSIKYKIITTVGAIIVGIALTIFSSSVIRSMDSRPEKPSLVERMVKAMESLAQSEREQSKRNS